MKLFDILLFIVLFIGIAVMAWGIHNEKQEGAKCLNNPLVFGVKYYAREDSNLSCTCDWDDRSKGSFEVFQEGMRPVLINKPLFDYKPTE